MQSRVPLGPGKYHVVVLVYLETSSPQRVNNILKLPGVLRLMLRKTGKQRCKNPGVPSEDRGNWGWECDGLFYRVFALREECRVLWSITPYTFISPTKMTIFFGTVRSTNDDAWKNAKWAKFMLALTRWQISHYELSSCEFVLQKHWKTLWLPTWKPNSNAQKCASDVKQKRRIVVNRISKVRQTTCNRIKKMTKQLE